MPFRQPNSRHVWISYYLGGRQVKESTRQTDWRAAKAIEQEKRAWAAQQRVPDARFLFDALMDRYLEDIRDEKRHDRAFWACARLTEFFSGTRIPIIDGALLREYRTGRRERGVKDSTIDKELRILSAAINHAIREWSWPISNPIKMRWTGRPGRIRWLKRDEARKLIAAAGTVRQAAHLPDAIIIALNTGLRRGELLALEWPRVDMKRNLVYLEPDNQKSGGYSSVPLNPAAKAAIKRQQGNDEHWVFVHNELPIRDIKKSFATARARAGIVDFHFHDLRHTCAAWLVQAGVPIRTVAEILRHKSIQTSMRYAHLAPDNARRAVAAINFG
jgi:integrase